MSLEEINKMINDTVHTVNIPVAQSSSNKFMDVTDCPNCRQKSFMPVRLNQGLAFATITLQTTQGFETANTRIFWKTCQNCGCAMSFFEQLTKM